jgi:hypothetical protein
MVVMMNDATDFCRGRRAAGLVLAALVAMVSSCQIDSEPRASRSPFRGADVTIRGAGATEVKSAVVDVMTEQGFRLASPFGSVMTFERDGTRHDEWMYGAYGSRPTRQRVTITTTYGEKPDTIDLVATGIVVREFSAMSGEETGHLFARGALRYGKYLDMIRDRVHSERRESEPMF